MPESCFVSMMKGVKIEKLDAKFNLVSHPLPQVEGELLIFQPKKDDQSEEDLIVYRDYSLRKRCATADKPATSMSSLKKKKPVEEPECKLQCLEIDLENPLSNIEWRNLAAVLNEVKGLCWFQILPVGQKCSQPYQFNMIHILPEYKMPVDKLPIDVFIANKMTYRKKMEKRQSDGGFQATRLGDHAQNKREAIENEAE